MPTTTNENPVQSSATFTCPDWCIEDHDRALAESEEGVMHAGQRATWTTARQTEMSAHLEWFEPLDRAPRPDDGAAAGPFIEFDGSDGSGFVGFNELDLADVGDFVSIVVRLGLQWHGRASATEEDAP